MLKLITNFIINAILVAAMATGGSYAKAQGYMVSAAPVPVDLMQIPEWNVNF